MSLQHPFYNTRTQKINDFAQENIGENSSTEKDTISPFYELLENYDAEIKWQNQVIPHIVAKIGKSFAISFSDEKYQEIDIDESRDRHFQLKQLENECNQFQNKRKNEYNHPNTNEEDDLWNKTTETHKVSCSTFFPRFFT